MVLEFVGEAIEWRGPAPFIFVPVPPELSAEINAISASITYGWGVIPAVVQIGETRFSTSLFPRKGNYLVPLKVVVQRAENLTIGDMVHVILEVGAV